MAGAVVQQAERIGQKPADRHAPPDAHDADARHGRQRVGQRHTQPQRDHGQHDRHARPPQRAVQPVQQKQQADQRVERALDAQVANALGDDGGLGTVNEQRHQLRRKQEHEPRQRQPEADRRRGCRADALADARALARAIVLRNEDRERVAEILHRQVGEGVDLDRRRKRGHHGGAKAVDQPLHGQDAQVHDGLLQAGQRRKTRDLPDAAAAQAHGRVPPDKRREPHPGVRRDAKARDILRNDRRLGRARHAAPEPGHEPQVQHDVEPGRHGQKRQRRG